jgi:hypothetical protein
MLRERWDVFERLTVAGTVPVRLEFSSVERGPFPDEPHGALG